MEYGWLIFASMLVFLMQAGFLCLESGKIRSKNNINVAAKNLADFIIASLAFWMVGFGLMFGASSWGIVGTSEFFFGADHSPWQFSFFFFQTMFCGTAATILSGAVAERMAFIGYVAITLVLSTIIYPVVGHWGWASVFNNQNSGWLEQFGFIDFAGSTIVHSVGGWVALAAIIIIGPRTGRFNSANTMPVGSNLPISVLGTLLIWLGWFGFNGGSTLTFSDNVPHILLATSLAAAWGGVTATIISVKHQGYVDVTHMLNGVIAGLVAVTAGANIVSPISASIIGAIAGVVMYLTTLLLERWQLDDVIGVIPTHLFAGIWGTLAAALFGTPFLDNGLGAMFSQLLVQILGITTIGAYSFGISYVALRLINQKVSLRVTAEQELLGLNITEHKASTELIDLLVSMDNQERQGDFKSKVPEEPFTEVGQIARQYNRVIQRVQNEMTERDLAIEDFRSSEKRKNAILQSSMDSIITIDGKGNIMEFNPASERIFGRLKNQVAGKNFIDLFILERDKLTAIESLALRFMSSNGLLLNRRNSIILRRCTGDEFPAEITITGASLGTSANSEFTLHIRDVTRQRKLQEKLKQLAYSDPLTGLYNRTFLIESLENAISHIALQQNSVAVFFLDLDRFKKINDTLGHKAGDELLMEVALRLTQVTRESDIIARWGGDEFVIVMSGALDQITAQSCAQKVLNVMRSPVTLSGKELKIPTSIGIAMTHTTQVTADSLIQQADIAMYCAKQAGRDNYKIFIPEMATQANLQFNFEQTLRTAIKNKTGIHVVYQPKVDQYRNLTGLEALARFTSEEGEIIPPSVFIPAAEDASLIIDLEEQIVIQVLTQLTEWRKIGCNLPQIAINLSGKHLLSETFLPFIKSSLAKFGIDGTTIQIEVTEGVFLNDIAKCKKILGYLRQLGISVAIDDFGTGYSSLNYLKSLPVDVLKIDKSFVDDCSQSEDDGKICSTIITLAENLHLETVAEGVETIEQFTFLTKNGCQQFQGYYFYRPLPPQQITPLLQR